MEQLGAWLKEARVRRGTGSKPLSMRAASIEIGCTENSYLHWEQGERMPEVTRNGLLQKLAQFTGRSEVEILQALGVLSDAQMSYSVYKSLVPSAA